MGAFLKPAALLLCALYAGSAHAQDIGRLFMTPDERTALERMRRTGKAPAAGPAAQAETSLAPSGSAPTVLVPTGPVRAAAQGDQVLVVNGIVRRSGPGRNTTWVDSVPYSETARVAGGVALARGRSNASVALTLRSGRQVNVRAGQHVDAQSGRIGDSYQDFPAPAPRKREPEIAPD